MNWAKTQKRNNKPKTKMFKKLVAIIALGLLVAGSAHAYTQTYGGTVNNGQTFTQGYNINAPSAVSFSSSAWCTVYPSGGNFGVSGSTSYSLWFGGGYPSTVSHSATGAAGSYIVYFNIGSAPGGSAHAETTVSW